MPPTYTQTLTTSLNDSTTSYDVLLSSYTDYDPCRFRLQALFNGKFPFKPYHNLSYLFPACPCEFSARGILLGQYQYAPSWSYRLILYSKHRYAKCHHQRRFRYQYFQFCIIGEWDNVVYGAAGAGGEFGG